jgi:hypothetical protein
VRKPLQVIEGDLILRAWDRTADISQTSARFSSLDEPYAYYLAASEPQLIDRIVIHGHDDLDQPRILTFVFQEITVSPRPE